MVDNVRRTLGARMGIIIGILLCEKGKPRKKICELNKYNLNVLLLLDYLTQNKHTELFNNEVCIIASESQTLLFSRTSAIEDVEWTTHFERTIIKQIAYK